MGRVMLIGAAGAIGRALCGHLVRQGSEVVCVGRRGVNGRVSFEEALRHHPGEYDLIVDASSGSLNDYAKLVEWLEGADAPRVVHFSSVRVDASSERDGYALYKRGVLLLLGRIAARVLVIKGDLFSHRGRLLGYWRFVRDIGRWTVISPRDVTVTEVEDIARLLAKLMAGAHVGTVSTDDGLWLLDVSAKPCRVLRTSEWWVSTLLKLRLNSILRYFRLCLVP